MATPAPDPPPSPPPSFYQSVKAYLATWVEVLKTRVELFSLECEEERERLEQIVILAATTLLCLTFGVLLVTLFVVVAFWETNYRLAVLGGFAVFYLAAGTVVGLITRRKSRTRPKLFSATIGELAKDYRHLSS
jgi:uncharacterized membrane protein YqjE